MHKIFSFFSKNASSKTESSCNIIDNCVNKVDLNDENNFENINIEERIGNGPLANLSSSIKTEIEINKLLIERKHEDVFSFLPEPIINHATKVDLSNYKYFDKKSYLNQNLQSGIEYLQSFSNNVKLELPLIWSFEEEKYVIKNLIDLKNILIVGTQATGKTTLLNQFILSLIITNHPEDIKLVLADAKKVEFNIYKKIEKHFLAKLPGEYDPIINDPKKLVDTLNALCIEMDRRYDLLKEAGTRDLKEYNEKCVAHSLNPQKGHEYLPFIILLIDGLSNFSLYNKREIESRVFRLINDGYKVGLFNIISVGQFTTDVISNDLFSLIRHKIIFRLNTKEDYRKFLNTVKVKTNLNEGEFIYVDDSLCIGNTINLDYQEIGNVCDFISEQSGYPESYLLPEWIDEKDFNAMPLDMGDKDPLFEDAARLIVQNQMGSTSLIQRRMKLGYNRAGRLMDQLEQAGIVGPNLGSKAREVVVKTEADLNEMLELF